MPLESVNPFSGEVITTFPKDNSVTVENKIFDANNAYENWHKTSITERIGLLKALSKVIVENIEDWAKVASIEMGKPINEAIAELRKCALCCDWYAENNQILAGRVITTEYLKAGVQYQALGVILGIMPWNFPYWQVFRFAVPAILSGNTIVLKHASNVYGCAEKISTAFSLAGFPKGIFELLYIESSEVEGIIKHPKIKAVSLTGSEKAGASVAALAAKHIKKSVLELGGSDPFLVFEDANLEQAVAAAVSARFGNAGQSCIAAKRFIVHKNIEQKFLQLFANAVSKLKTGNPIDNSTQIGPMAKPEFVKELENILQKSVQQGAEIYFQAMVPNNDRFFPPTILHHVNVDMPVMQLETFGPLAPVISFNSDDEAIAIANNTQFGLGAAAFTLNKTLQTKLLNNLLAGTIFINNFVKSDVRLPFGGIKNSGFGRELSQEALVEFVNCKSFAIS